MFPAWCRDYFTLQSRRSRHSSFIIVLNSVAILWVLMLPYRVRPISSPPSQCLSPDLISNHEGEVSIPSPTIPIPLSPPPSRPLASHTTNPPLYVYRWSRDRRVVSYSTNATSSSSKVHASSASLPLTNDLPIALGWGKLSPID